MRTLAFISLLFVFQLAFCQPSGRVVTLDQDQYLKLDDIKSLGPMQAVTVALWARHDRWMVEQQEALVDCLEFGGFAIQLHQHEIKGAVMRQGYSFVEYPAGELMPGWHHLALVYDGAALRLFIDGLLKNEKRYDSAKAIVYPKEQLPLLVGVALGYGHPEKQTHFSGQIDQLQLFDVALEPEEINALYLHHKMPSATPRLSFDFEQCNDGCVSLAGDHTLQEIGEIDYPEVHYFSPLQLSYWSWFSSLIAIGAVILLLIRKSTLKANPILWTSCGFILMEALNQLPPVWIWLHTAHDWLQPSPFGFIAGALLMYLASIRIGGFRYTFAILALLLLILGIVALALPAVLIIYAWVIALLLLSAYCVLLFTTGHQPLRILICIYVAFMAACWWVFYDYGLSYATLNPLANIPALVLFLYLHGKLPAVVLQEAPAVAVVIDFSKREKEVASLILQGLSDQEIADKLFISINTTRTHIKNVYKKLEVSTRARAILEIGRRPHLLD